MYTKNQAFLTKNVILNDYFDNILYFNNNLRFADFESQNTFFSILSKS